MTLDVTWLGHSTVVLDVDGMRVLTDPLLRRHVGPLRRRGATPARDQWRDPDVVLLSHLHHDHADLRSLRCSPTTSPSSPRRRTSAGCTATGWPASPRRTDDWMRPVPGSPSPSGCARRSTRRAPCRTAQRGDGPPRPVGRPGPCGSPATPRSSTRWPRSPSRPARPVDLALVPDLRLGPPTVGRPHGTGRGGRGLRGWSVHGPRSRCTGAPCTRPSAATCRAGWMDRPAVQFAAAMAERAPGCRVVVPPIGERCPISADSR